SAPTPNPAPQREDALGEGSAPSARLIHLSELPTSSCHESHRPMIRVLVYLAVVALLAFGAVWLADRPGDGAITWQGERVETSVMVAAAAVAAIAIGAVLLWSILRAI